MKLKTELRQEQFAHAYVNNGFNAKQAYLEVSPNVTEGSAGVEGHRMLMKPKVLSTIAYDLSNLTDEWLKSEFLLERDKATRSSDRLRALEDLAKIQGLMRDTNININNVNGISSDDVTKIRQAIRETKFPNAKKINESKKEENIIETQSQVENILPASPDSSGT